ncbi:hypothetical protein GVN18_36245 [Pseudomonas sp. ODNR1LW]|nr:hypothetical protein [Pseudomonas sp. ODNR1LW]
MRPAPLRRVLILSTVLITAVAGSGSAMAQASRDPGDVTAEGLRYLSWPGKTANRAAIASPRTAPPTPAARSLPRIAAAAPTSRGSGLTPASAWIPAPAATPTPVAALPAPPPEIAPVVPAARQSNPSASAEPDVDPLAPRRDALIFRLQPQSAAQSSPPPAAAPVQTAEAAPAARLGARLYSVHRQAGLKPDPISAPQPVYLDGLPVELTQPPASADLAQPGGPPALLRSSDGSIRAAPQTQEDDLP